MWINGYDQLVIIVIFFIESLKSAPYTHIHHICQLESVFVYS